MLTDMKAPHSGLGLLHPMHAELACQELQSDETLARKQAGVAL